MDTDQIRKAAGHRLAAVRKYNNLSQAEMARILGVTPGAINNYENGRSLISQEMAHKLLSYFNLNSNWLYFGVDEPMGAGVVRSLEAILRGEDVHLPQASLRSEMLLQSRQASIAISRYILTMMDDLLVLDAEQHAKLVNVLREKGHLKE